ncbi:MAG: hypothetical protein QM621_01395 [Aeromicrobium sp.]|uniref:hypothetical protein n=1 Tax=Aeromicrobium sp. TaxID=1871063 RepID=UPI0039E28F87
MDHVTRVVSLVVASVVVSLNVLFSAGFFLFAWLPEVAFADARLRRENNGTDLPSWSENYADVVGHTVGLPGAGLPLLYSVLVTTLAVAAFVNAGRRLRVRSTALALEQVAASDDSYRAGLGAAGPSGA